MEREVSIPDLVRAKVEGTAAMAELGESDYEMIFSLLSLPADRFGLRTHLIFGGIYLLHFLFHFALVSEQKSINQHTIQNTCSQIL